MSDQAELDEALAAAREEARQAALELAAQLKVPPGWRKKLEGKGTLRVIIYWTPPED
jgi:hypothetical protein